MEVKTWLYRQRRSVAQPNVVSDIKRLPLRSLTNRTSKHLNIGLIQSLSNRLLITMQLREKNSFLHRGWGAVQQVS